MTDAQWDRLIRRARDLAFFLLPVIILANEFLIKSEPNAAALGVLPLMGMPFAFKQDEKRQEHEKEMTG